MVLSLKPLTSASVLNVWLATWLCTFFAATVDAVQCFCTSRDQPCQNPICDGSWCLVGFKNEDLVQTCGTDVARSLTKCARKLNDWEEVCSCHEDFCNTFAYMRENLKLFDNNPQAKKDMQNFDASRIVDERAVVKSNKKLQKNEHLIVLLVVLPLGVGALTVCVIFINYHCKMC